MKDYLSSDGRFTPKRKTRIVSGTGVIIISTGTIHIRSADSAEWQELGLATDFAFTDLTPPPMPSFSLPRLSITFTGKLSDEAFENLTRALRPTVGGPWHLAWVNPATGDEGRTEGAGWATQEDAEAAAQDWRWRSLHPDRLWWPVREAQG